VTARVARAHGAGDSRTAARIGVQALLLATLLGVTVSIAGLALAGPIVEALGASGRVGAFAEPYLRVRILAAGPVLIALVGHGWLRGAQDTRTPTVIALTGAVFHFALEYILIYPAGLGVAGAAWATVAGQGGAAIAFLVVLARRFEAPAWRWHRPTLAALLTIGAELAVRTGSLLAGLTFATAVAARMGPVALGSWQIAMEIFLLLALSLDSVAIAAQALIGRRLGEGDAAGARSLSERLMCWGVLCGLGLGALMLPLSGPVALVFTDDPAVARAAAHLLLWIALLQPLAAAAFTLDGVLIGAADTRFLALSMTASSAAFICLAYIALDNGWGTAGLATGATVWMVGRATTTGLRWRRGRWVTAG
jgi:putative MATE family efflux protein